MHSIRRSTLVLAIVSALVAGAVASTAAASTHGHAAAYTKYPPCTKAALSAGLKRGPVAIRNGRFQKSFGCARNWAYSGVIVGKGNGAFEATVLYHNNKGRWQTSRRPGPCRAHAVPKKIYKPACTTN